MFEFERRISMKISKHALLIILSVILIQMGFAHCNLVYPVGGETFQVGEVVTIQWEVVIYHGPNNWDLYFSDDGGSTWQPIALNLPDSQLDHDWTVTNTETDSGKVKVVQDNDNYMNFSSSSGNFSINTTTGMKEPVSFAEDFVLFPAYPNPFNPITTIRYSLSAGTQISLKIYNVLGERVKTLIDGFQSPGENSVVWDGKNDRGEVVGSGVYIYRLRAGREVKMRTMTLLK
jgi:hypothetical protein